jgi:BolA family transcriptional regulator, general stress-responsive regulator
MRVADRIRTKLETAFAPTRLVVSDDSARHAGHAGARPGGETHFTVEIVAAAFSGLSRIERQRRVHAVLAEELAGRVHALSIRALAPEEGGDSSVSATEGRG